MRKFVKAYYDKDLKNYALINKDMISSFITKQNGNQFLTFIKMVNGDEFYSGNIAEYFIQEEEIWEGTIVESIYRLNSDLRYETTYFGEQLHDIVNQLDRLNRKRSKANNES